jgi:hypothetical protein
MVLFEAIAAVSIAIALGTLTVVSVVLRPRYEERFKEFNERKRNDLLKKFEIALAKLRESGSNTLPEETYEMIDNLFDYWKEYGSVEPSLESYLLRQRNLVVAWLAFTVLSVLSIQYDSQLLGNTMWGPLTLGALTVWGFLALVALSVKFYWDLLTLDMKLSEVSTSEPHTQSTSVASVATRGAALQNTLASALTINKIPHQMNVRMKDMSFDFVIPNNSAPKFIIETKQMFTRLGEIEYTRFRIQKFFPNAKRILFFGTPLAVDKKKKLQETWDYVFDSTEVESLLGLLGTAGERET